MRLTLALLFIVCNAECVLGQAAWAGFQYGMTPAQVRAMFRIPMHEASGVENVRDFPYTLVAEQPVQVQRIGFTAKFSFDENKHLQMISLYSMRNDPALSADVSRHFAEALSGKYGPPVIEKAACEADTADQICRATWRDGRQRITLAFRNAQDQSVNFLYLAYEVNAADL